MRRLRCVPLCYRMLSIHSFLRPEHSLLLNAETSTAKHLPQDPHLSYIPRAPHWSLASTLLPQIHEYPLVFFLSCWQGSHLVPFHLSQLSSTRFWCHCLMPMGWVIFFPSPHYMNYFPCLYNKRLKKLWYCFYVTSDLRLQLPKKKVWDHFPPKLCLFISYVCWMSSLWSSRLTLHPFPPSFLLQKADEYGFYQWTLLLLASSWV